MVFSVLIPAYNVESYIRKCLDSIKHQLFADFEAIIIDDGSTDRTLQICKEYESCDKRFNVYHQDNIGIVNTRNRLLELAKGEWVTFLDADDDNCQNQPHDIGTDSSPCSEKESKGC